MAQASPDTAIDAAAVLDAGEEAEAPRWASVWHLPVLVLGVCLVGVGVFLSLPETEVDDFDGALDAGAKLLIAGNFEVAAEQLDQVGSNIDRATPQQQARYHLLAGDLVYLKQHGSSWLAIPTNHQMIVESYQKAQELVPPLDAVHLQRLAESLVALGRDQEAMQLLIAMKDAEAHRRYGVVRRVIETRAQDEEQDPERLLALITRYLDEVRRERDTAKRRAARIWAAGVKADLMLAAGDADGAGRELEQVMIRFMNEGGDDDLAPLMAPLAKAFQTKGNYAEAERWYQLAQQKLDPGDALNARVLVGLGQIAQSAHGNDQEALEHFSAAETDYPSTPYYLTSLLGRADAEARLGMHPEAIEHFGRAVEMHLAAPAKSAKDRTRIEVKIQSHFDRLFDGETYERGLDYLALLQPLYEGGLPDDKLAMLAATHERLADKRHATGRGEGRATDQPTDPAAEEAARKLARQEAAIHYEKAGDYHLAHARAVTVKDDSQFGRSLWQAAASYDRAQRWKRAIDVYAEFIKLRPQDPKRLDAVYRLALTFQADGQYEAAIDLFKQLIEEHGNSTQAYNSLVPLAQSYNALGEVDQAKQVLAHVVTNHPAITPDSATYRRALVQLGKLHHKLDEFEPAIERLVEATERFGMEPEAPRIRFLLGDAYRLSVEEIDQSLKQQMPQSKRAALQTERERRLEQGRMLFSQVIAELESKPATSLTALDQLYLRNAYFYRADAVYDLGRYEEAINLYDLTARRWESHPASLIALVQIVNSYAELGQVQEAKVANDRARWQLDRIPEDAFDDPTLPMSREHWQDWLKWTSELRLFDEERTVGS